MKNIILKVLFALILLSFISCSTMQKVFTSKRYKRAISTIDTLRRESRWLKADTTIKYDRIGILKHDLANAELNYKDEVKLYEDLYDSFNNINVRYKGLTSRYNDLLNSNLNKTSQLNNALKLKTQEIQDKEKLLQEREKKVKELEDIIRKQDSASKTMMEAINNALFDFNTDELSIKNVNGKVYISMQEKLLFKSGSAKVEEKGIVALKKLAEVLNKNPDINILVEGHTDNVPIHTDVYKDNWDLSTARATSIVRILVQNFKVSPLRLISSGRSEFFPVADNDNTKGKAKNRRTEIILSPNLDTIYKVFQVKK